MAEFIVLTKEEADAVAGQGLYGRSLNPLQRDGDYFVLASCVLDDPAYAPWVDVLKDKPKMESDAEDFPAPYVEPEEEAPPAEPETEEPPAEETTPPASGDGPLSGLGGGTEPPATEPTP